MQQNQRIILYVLILITGAAWILISTDPTNANGNAKSSAPQAGFIAPDFTLNTPSGEPYNLSELKGRAILVNFWATWCPPCRAEMQTIEKIYLEYKVQGFIVLAINTTYQDDPFLIIPFTTGRNLTFPILLDETGEVANAYQLHSLPSSFFIDRTGKIRKVAIGGPMSEALLRTRIEEILK